MKQIKSFLIGLLVLGFISCNQSNTPVYLDNDQPIEKRIEDALSRMTLEEKVALCHAQSKFSSHGVPRLGIPEIWMSDGPHGVREEISWDSWSPAGWTNDSCTAFPALTCLASTLNPALSYDYGVAVGEEARYRKKDILLGPGVNIYRTPLNGRNFEYMGEDPLLASRMVAPYVQGVQSNGVAACVKHYALNNQEVWRGHIDVAVSDRALHEIYLPAFRAAVQEGGAWSIMGAYNKFRGEHCCHNDLLLNKILKTDWGFDGVVVTDWGGAHDTHQAAYNGLDIEMGTYTNGLSSGPDFAYDDYYLAKPFLEKLRSGEIPESIVDEKARRILRLIFRTSMSGDRPYGRFVNDEHSAVARRVAQEGIVLLKNDEQVLPLVPGTVQRIAVIGENATRSLTKGGGSSELKVKYEVSPLEGIQKAYGVDKVFYAKGYSSGPSVYGREEAPNEDQDLLLAEALALAATSDVVILVGGLNKNHYQDSEGGDRIDFHLPFQQDRLITELLKVNPRLILVLATGNAVAMPWIADVPAIVQSWYLGSESGHVIADILSGAVNPSGKLPFSFPVKLEDNAAHSFGSDSYPGDSVKQYYKEDILVGYRWFDTKQIVPQFAFGHGLSYTTFEYGPIKASKKSYRSGDVIELEFRLTNTGKVAGAEAVQIYTAYADSKIERAAKELKAFDKVFLEAGKSRQVSLSVKVDDLAYYNESTSKWELEKGELIISSAAASNDIRSETRVELK